MIYQFELTATATDLTTRQIAWSTVETDRGPREARRLAVLDFEERGEMRGQPGLSVDEIPSGRPGDGTSIAMTENEATVLTARAAWLLERARRPRPVA